MSKGPASYYQRKIDKLWNRRQDPEVYERIRELLEKKQKYSPCPSVKKEASRTTRLLKAERKLKKNDSSEPSSASKKVASDKDGSPVDVEKFLATEAPDVTFEDIGGLDDVKKNLWRKVIQKIRTPELYEALDLGQAGGVLLYGPPGCGKTLIVKALAGESGITYIAPRISEIMHKYVGQSEKMVAKIFDRAREEENALLFFDEFEVIAPRSGPSYTQRVSRQFQGELDGFSSENEGILFLAGTNRPWRCEPAMRRPPRFEDIIFIPPPDQKGRKKIFEIHCRSLEERGKLAEDVDFRELALRTEGYSGADIASIVRNAKYCSLDEAIEDCSKNPRPVQAQDFHRSIEKRKPSVIHWMDGASRQLKRYGEEAAFEDLADWIVTAKERWGKR